ncbi:septum formation inhibitor Maf [Aquimarina sp. ERC-38]|uniref:septum formation inhibitor Maf n=1 Tax=Aquimarina sp. ERC-38 TaxID=2949996 RepID=UPI0022483C1A|nr:septum formation inhibitor Maf [Aquimarina sp. ERC-38]UZO80062.1 septum formation inhibitor Maf [Aquimarina sp. ERC-38]
MNRKYLHILLLSSILFYTCGKSGKSNAEQTASLVSGSSQEETVENNPKPLSEAFKKYWYNGTAEITSYDLQQARYGEMREGNAVLIYVTEEFLPEEQVKANRQNPTNIPVLKLNMTRNFNTGIYPYSIMESTFYPTGNHQHALKTVSSMQEWCGQMYAQLNNRSKFEITTHSYFEGEEDQDFTLDKAILENELWLQIRIDPTSLPIGSHSVIPGLAYANMKHIALKSHPAELSLQKQDSTNVYTIQYPKLQRKLQITFTNTSPYTITSWEETYISRGKEMTSKATLKKQIRSAYWGKNSNLDEVLREELGL